MMFHKYFVLSIVLLIVFSTAGLTYSAIGIFDRTADWGGSESPPQLGNHKISGSASYSEGTYIIQGQGDDIGGSSDEGFYLYTELSGSQVISGRVVWMDTNNHEWSKIGLMMREKGADSASRYYWCMLRGQSYGDQIHAQWRDERRGESGGEEIRPASNPQGHITADADAAIWFRLTRIAEANLVFSEWSYDGEVWNFGHSRSMDFPAFITWGIAITNHQDNKGVAVAHVEGLKIEKPQVVFGVRSMDGPRHFAQKTYFRPGDQFHVTLHLTNTHEDALAVDVLESVPKGWDITSISHGGINTGGTIVWSGHTVPVGTEGTLTYTVKVPSDANSSAVFRGSTGPLSILGDTSLVFLGESIGFFDGYADIGSVSLAGFTRFYEDVNEYELEGSGTGIWEQEDGFHFLFKEISGPFTLRGRVDLDPLESFSEWMKAGLMVRDSLVADSPNAMVMLRPDYQHAAQWRLQQGGDSQETALSDDNFGDFEIEKIGNRINLYAISAQLGNRILCQSVDIAMMDPVYVGCAVSSTEDGSASLGYFQNMELIEHDGYAERYLASESLLAGGGKTIGNTITVNLSAGKTSSGIVIEELPIGFKVENIQVSNGTVQNSENQIAWTLENLSGTGVMTYGLVVPNTSGDTVATFSGSFNGFPISGVHSMYPVVFEIPFIDQVVRLDGVIDEGEYEGAYMEIFDHADRIPPGVHWSPLGGELDRRFENATFRIFHNADFIYVAIDVLDTQGLDFESSEAVWQNDSTELYLDGNLSRSNPKEANANGFQAIVLGNGARSAGTDAPSFIEQTNGGGSSVDGEYWNAGARVKDTGEGYIVEYAVKKSEILYPSNRTVIGFDILMNSAEGTGERTARWGYWNTRLGALETDLDASDNEQGWAVVELSSHSSTSMSSWELY